MSGYVYFFGPENMWGRDGWEAVVKIGHTKRDPFARMHDLEAGSPLYLEMYCYFEGPQALEKAFHEAFGSLRSHREWFFNQRKLRDFLGYLYEPPAKREPVDRGRLIDAVYDCIMADCAPGPWVSDEEYLASCEHQLLEPWFPEAAQ